MQERDEWWQADMEQIYKQSLLTGARCAVGQRRWVANRHLYRTDLQAKLTDRCEMCCRTGTGGGKQSYVKLFFFNQGWLIAFRKKNQIKTFFKP